MSKDYDVGFGKPPREHRFSADNQPRRRRSGKASPRTIPKALAKALGKKLSIRRSGKVERMTAMDVLVERLVQMIVHGTASDLVKVMQMIERYAPASLESVGNEMVIRLERSDGSSIELPSREQWESGS